MTALKSCPFCGGKQKEPHIWYGNGGAHECQSCRAMGPKFSDVGQTMAENKPGVIAVWNRRTTDRAALVEVARRGCNTFAYGTDSVPDAEVLRAAEEIVTEYLAEQEGIE